MPKRIGFNDAQADWRRAGRVSALGVIEHGVQAPGVVRWAVIGFLALWLVGWTSGIVFAFIALFGIAADNVPLSSFLFIWLIFAAFGWVFVVRAILRLLRGQPLPRSN